jgi:hypothetical protein
VSVPSAATMTMCSSRGMLTNETSVDASVDSARCGHQDAFLGGLISRRKSIQFKNLDGNDI